MNLQTFEKVTLVLGLMGMMGISYAKREGKLEVSDNSRMKATYLANERALRLELYELKLAQFADDESQKTGRLNWRDRYALWENENRVRLAKHSAMLRELELLEPFRKISAPRTPKPVNAEEFYFEVAKESLDEIYALLRKSSGSDEEARLRIAEWELKHPEYSEEINSTWKNKRDYDESVLRPVVMPIKHSSGGHDVLLNLREELIQRKLDQPKQNNRRNGFDAQEPARTKLMEAEVAKQYKKVVKDELKLRVNKLRGASSINNP